MSAVYIYIHMNAIYMNLKNNNPSVSIYFASHRSINDSTGIEKETCYGKKELYFPELAFNN